MSDYLADVRKLAVEIALEEVKKGVKESDGRNRGPEIDKYMSRSTSPPEKHRDWCGMFIYYCFDEASKRLGKPLPIKPGSLWGGRKFRKWCGANWNKVIWDLPLQPGDIYVMYRGHIGLIVGSYTMDDIFQGRIVQTIDGNQMIDKVHDPTKLSLVKRHRDFAEMQYVVRF